MTEINDATTPPEDDTRTLAQELGRELSARTILFHQAVADRLGIGITDHKCLDLAHRAAQKQPVTAGLLAEETGLTTGAITGVLDRLEKAGFIRREKHPTDRRQVIVRVLPDRAADFDAIFGPFQEAWDRFCREFAPEQLTVIRRFIEGSARLMSAETERLRRETGARTARLDAVPGSPSLLEQSAPLGALREATLVLARGTTQMTLGGCDDDRLFRARFDKNPATVKVDGGHVEILQKHGFMGFGQSGGEVLLSERLPWSIVVRGGAHRLEADLRRLALAGYELTGGASESQVRLPHPSGTVVVKHTGGISKLRLAPPAGVPFRLIAKGGCSQLVVDRLQLGAVGGVMRWESPDFAAATDRYDFEIRGGASELSVVPEPA